MKLSWKSETNSEKVERWQREAEPYFEYYKNWHKWFAWYPVIVSTEHRIWLQFVERRYESGGGVVKDVWHPIYREIK